MTAAHVRPRRDATLLVSAVLLVALLAFAAAPLGMTAVYVLAGLIGIGVGGWLLRAELRPPLERAWRRAQPGLRARSSAITARHLVVVLVIVTGLAFVAGSKGLLAVGALAALPVLGLLGFVLWPALTTVVRRVPVDVPARAARPVLARPAASTRARVAGAVLVLVALTGASFVLAGMGLKGVIALVGLVAIVGTLAIARNRSVVVTFLTAASLTFLLHKSFSVQNLHHSGGAISVYVTSFDALLVVLYGLWVYEGTFVADVRAGLRQPFVLLPLVGLFFLLFSVPRGPSPVLELAELSRMVWMYLLFFYAAVRIRTREHVVAVLAGLGVFAALEFIVVVLQWRTGGVLGLGFLGVPTTLTQRTTDISTIGRPFGTITHPVFMGAAMGSLALVSLSLAISLRRSLAKVIAGVMVALCAIPLYLSHTRASALAAVIAGLYVVGATVRRRWLSWATIGRWALAGVVGGLALLPSLVSKFDENFATSHFWEEVRSRLQLNGLAYRMWNDHILAGAGLNNFEIALPHYESHYVIFANNPVHNLYLMMLSETGIIGFAGFALVALGMLRAAWQVTRSQDRLVAGIGIGVVGMTGFLGLEELLGFSLRQDVPLALYWLMAGLVLACARLATTEAAPGRVVARPLTTTGSSCV